MKNSQTAPRSILPPTTAAIYPEKFFDAYAPSKLATIVVLSLCLLIGFVLRTTDLGAESLSEDELNKLQTVAEYRAEGLTGRNGEHPFLMKGLQTASVSAAEKLNLRFASLQISDEAALRFPTAVFGTFTALLLFLLFRELFGSSIALICAALWSVDPTAIGFDRIAKEDSFLLFFFLLSGFFWVRSQTLAERGRENWMRYVWLAAIASGAMLASKYLVHLLAISAAYYNAFQGIEATKWRLGKTRWLKFFVIAGISFVIFNPTILLPETWREMLTFSSEKRIGHDAYEFAGELYRNKMTLWTAGVPWTFYYVFVLVKTPIPTLLFFFAGLVCWFRRRLGDGRWFVFFWAFMWLLPFTFLGGKFTRYFTIAAPLVLITAAIGVYFSACWLAEKLFDKNFKLRRVLIWTLPAILIVFAFAGSLSVVPHFRLYLNPLASNHYFPHDEFYDASTEEIVRKIAAVAQQNAVVVVETPGLFAHYARKIGREDLHFVSLSDEAETVKLAAGDFIVVARGRRYFSNDNFLKYLESSVQSVDETRLGEIISAKIYLLDDNSAIQIRELSKE